jgi:hypothetical protein
MVPGQVVWRQERRDAAHRHDGELLPIRRFNVGKGEIDRSDETLKTKLASSATLSRRSCSALRTLSDARSHRPSSYRVIGVLEPKGNSPFGEDQTIAS